MPRFDLRITADTVHTGRVAGEHALAALEAHEGVSATLHHRRRKSDSRVQTAALRDAFKRSGKTYTEACRALGWERRQGAAGRCQAETTRFKRAIGLVPQGTRRGRPGKASTTINYDLAVDIIRALDFDPVDFGL